MQIRNNTGPKLNPCGTTQDIFPKSESLFSIFATNNLSETYHLTGLLMSTLCAGDKSPVQRGFFTNSKGGLLPVLGFWVGCIILVIL